MVAATDIKNRNPFTLLLSRAETGDPQALDKLCDRLANRLLLVPAMSQPISKGDNGHFSLETYHATVQGKKVYVAYTSEANFKNGCEAAEIEGCAVKLYGGDFCGALPEGSEVQIDAGCAPSVRLNSAAVRRIAEAPAEEELVQDAPVIVRKSPQPNPVPASSPQVEASLFKETQPDPVNAIVDPVKPGYGPRGTLEMTPQAIFERTGLKPKVESEQPKRGVRFDISRKTVQVEDSDPWSDEK